MISRAALGTHKWATMKTHTILIVMVKTFRIFVQITSFYFSQAFAITGSLAFPLATQVDKLIYIETFKVTLFKNA